jgi:glycosyltransferase involved in cell wall biosynthesis
MPALRRMVAELRQAQDLGGAIAWLYTPLALPLARLLNPELIVYDCMDELSAFLGAPAELAMREAEVLACADLVFTGGKSLYRAKRELHPDVHCFPSSVDADHFARALARCAEPPDQAGLPRPRLGFFGVIDERMDLGIVAALADARPDWSVVLVGPVVKIDPAELPRRPNLHYLGGKPYSALPDYLAGWDVCLMPFALNAATRFISPTKTLEYMAAEKPIVSTPIRDVQESYAGVVRFAHAPADFAAACAAALAEQPMERQRRIAEMQRILAATSWDHTASSMAALIDRALAEKGAAASGAAGAAHRPAPPAFASRVKDVA